MAVTCGNAFNIKSMPIDVDIVIDLGNSRTCGLLIEAQPDQLGADITQAVKLQLRDLSRPELVYSDPFDSRLEFSRASFGRDHLSLRSGRAEAFAWPTIVRVGPEATRLASLRRGSEGATGLSGPKRYLWDDDARRDSRRFNRPTAHGGQPGPPLPGLEQFADPGDRVPPLLQAGDALEAPGMGVVVEPSAADPGGWVQDLPGLVLADGPHRRARASRQLLHGHPGADVVDPRISNHA